MIKKAFRKNRKKILNFMFWFACAVISVLTIFFVYNFALRRICPLKYQAFVMESAQKHGVEPELIYAVIKTESNFLSTAESHKGALGLMQITPDTFEWLKLYTKEKEVDYQSLKNPQISIDYGTFMLAKLLLKYQNEDLTICAYNAGIATVDRWLKNRIYTKNGINLSFIPYKETREYLNKVKKYKKIYKNFLC